MTIIEYIRENESVSFREEPAAEKNRQAILIEADGYVRKSPRQELTEASDYRKKQMIRILIGILIVLALFAVFYGFWKIGFIKI